MPLISNLSIAMTKINPPSDASEDVSEDIIDLLQLALKAIPDTYIQVDRIVSVLGARSFGIAILIFSIPMMVPMPPGVPMTAGFVIAIFATQLLLGRASLWLPKWLADKQIKREVLAKAYGLADKYLGWMFRLARPRLPQLTGVIARRFAGLLFMILAVLMILPIPFIGNVLPAFACTILALGVTDKDGLIYLVGVVFAAITIGATSFMAVGTWNLVEALFN